MAYLRKLISKVKHRGEVLQCLAFAAGVVLVIYGCIDYAHSQSYGIFSDGGFSDSIGEFNDERIREVINRIFKFIEGSFGALVMVIAGIMAIVSAAFGQYRAALGLLVVAIGAFILRSLVHTFFNIDGV